MYVTGLGYAETYSSSRGREAENRQLRTAAAELAALRQWGGGGAAVG